MFSPPLWAEDGKQQLKIEDLDDLEASYRSVEKINENNDKITAGFNKTLSRDGSTPNNMQVPLDMDSNRIINLGKPLFPNDAVRLIDVTEAFGGEVPDPPEYYKLSDFGGKGDGVELTSVSVTSGNPMATAPGAVFTDDDVGKLIQIVGAGAGGTDLNTTIVDVVSPTVVEMAVDAGTSGSKTGFYGSNDLPSIRAAIQQIEADGGGKLVHEKNSISLMDLSGFSNGATVINVFNFKFFDWDLNGAKLVGIEDFSVGGDTTLYLLRVWNSRNVNIRNLDVVYTQDNTASSAFRGVTTLAIWGSEQVHFQGKQVGGRMGMWAFFDYGNDPSGVCSQVSFELETVTTAYPIVAYETQQLFGSLRATRPERSMFLSNVKQAHLEVESEDHVADDIIIVCENADGLGGVTSYSENLALDYRSKARTFPDLAGPMITLVMRSMAGDPAAMKGLTIKQSGDYTGQNVGFRVQRQFGNGTPSYGGNDSGPARGHIVTIDHYSANFDNSDSSISVVDFAQTWPVGEFVYVKDMSVNVAGTGGTLFINGDCASVPTVIDGYSPNVQVKPLNFGEGSTLFGSAKFGNISTTRRMVLNQDLGLYVRPDGSNSNPGLANLSDWAFQTIQYALDFARSFDINGHSIIINVDVGTYPETFGIFGPVVGSRGPSSIIVRGASNATLAQGAFVANGAQMTVENMRLQNSGQTTLAALSGSHLAIGDGVELGLADTHILSEGESSIVDILGDYTVSGASAANHILARFGGQVRVPSAATLTLLGVPGFTNHFLVCSSQGRALLVPLSYTGTATGSKFNVERLAYVECGSAGGVLPGNVAGTVDATTFGVIL